MKHNREGRKIMMRRKPDIKPPLTEEEIEKGKQAFIEGAKAD